MASSDEPTTYLLRVWLPDRPGGLGAVASRIGAVGADIVGVDVVERGGGQAVDDLLVRVPDDRLDLMLREIRAVDGVDVEELHAVGDGLADLGVGILEAAAAIVAAAGIDDLGRLVCDHARRIVRLDWVSLCRTDDGTVVTVSGDAPTTGWIGAYAIGTGARDSDSPDGPPEGDPHVAAAPLAATSLVVVAGRAGLSIRPRERELLAALSRLAAARWAEMAALPELG